MPESYVGPEWSVCEEYWGFSEPPFSLAPNPRFLCMTPMHQAALNTLLLSVMAAEPLVGLTGPQGCGKTSLCRKLGQELAPDTHLFIHASEPKSVPRDFLRAANGGRSGDWEEALQEVGGRGARLVLVVDDCHRALANADLTILEQILVAVRGNAPGATVLLVDELGAAPESLGDVRQSACASVAALDADSLTELLRFRMRTAWGPPEDAFAAEAYAELHVLSAGIPRVACEIADSALSFCMRQRCSRVDAEAIRAVHALLV